MSTRVQQPYREQTDMGLWAKSLLFSDTVAGILDSIWTSQVIVFILPVPTFFPKGANHVRTG